MAKRGDRAKDAAIDSAIEVAPRVIAGFFGYLFARLGGKSRKDAANEFGGKITTAATDVAKDVADAATGDE